MPERRRPLGAWALTPDDADPQGAWYDEVCGNDEERCVPGCDARGQAWTGRLGSVIEGVAETETMWEARRDERGWRLGSEGSAFLP